MQKKLSRLQALMATDHATNVKLEYRTTREDVEKWFDILNEEVFGGSLTKLDEIDIRRRRRTYAYYEYEPKRRRKKDRFSKLCMNVRYSSEKFFVEILAHELVHHYQYIKMQPMGHGPSFMAWKTLFREKGLNLAKSYVEEKPKVKRGLKRENEVESSQH